MRTHLLAAFGITFGAACAADPSAEDELSGSWRLVTICLYEREGPPCDTVTAPAVAELTFLAGARYVRRNPDEEGTYAVERRPAPAGGEELLIRFDGGSPAQLHATTDSLVVSWAYVDGPELRYVAVERD